MTRRATRTYYVIRRRRLRAEVEAGMPPGAPVVVPSDIECAAAAAIVGDRRWIITAVIAVEDDT